MIESGLKITSSYLDLNQKMYSKLEKNKPVNGDLKILNLGLSKELGIDTEFLASKEGIEFLTGSTDKYGPLFAQAYGGHQFGHFAMLGDGRAMNLGEQTSRNNVLFDLQLKGSGATPYSRRGDGKATLYSMLREYVISEVLHNLDIPTSRTLSVIKTNELIQRDEVEEAAILTRVANSHVRVGTFEYAKAYGNREMVKELADHIIERQYSYIKDKTNKYQLLLGEVANRQAYLIAKWQGVGFIHGVMNTDNMLISGDSIDFGPCAFMDTYSPDTVFSSIDRNGRYAYKKQPFIGSWNLSKFAETILELLDPDLTKAVDIANEELSKYAELFNKYWLSILTSKLGISIPKEEDKELVNEFLLLLEKYKQDYTNTFKDLSIDVNFELEISKTEDYKSWHKKWMDRLLEEKLSSQDLKTLMQAYNPYAIPRNHLVEEAILQASKEDNYDLLEALLKTLNNPFDYSREYNQKYLEKDNSKDKYVTYCGT